MLLLGEINAPALMVRAETLVKNENPHADRRAKSNWADNGSAEDYEKHEKASQHYTNITQRFNFISHAAH